MGRDLKKAFAELDDVVKLAKRYIVGKEWQRLLWRRDSGDKDYIDEFEHNTDSGLVNWRHIETAYKLLNDQEQEWLTKELETEYPLGGVRKVQRDTPHGFLVEHDDAVLDCVETFMLDKLSRKWVAEFNEGVIDRLRDAMTGRGDANVDKSKS